MFKNIYKGFFIFFITFLSLVFFIHESRVFGIGYIDLARLLRVNLFARLFLVFILGIFLYFIYKIIQKFSKKQTILFAIFIGVTSIAFKYMWFVNFTLFQFWDMEALIELAELNHVYESFATRDYLYVAPHNTFEVFYLMLVNLFNFNNSLELVDMGRFMNMIWLLCMQGVIYKIVKEIKDEKSAIFSLVVTTMCIPLTAFMVFVYNDIPATLLYLLSTYMYILFFKEERLCYAFLGALFLMIGQALRSVGFIFAFTTFLYVFTIIKKYDKKHVTLVIITVLAFVIPNVVLSQGMRIAFKDNPTIVENYGLPIYHYLGAGISRGGDTDTPGFFDASYSYLYTSNKENKELANELMKDKYFTQMKNHTLYDWGQIMYYKFVFQWCDGNFEVDYFNSIGHEDDEMYPAYSTNTPIRQFISTGIIGRYFDNYNHSFWHLIVLVVAIYTLVNKNRNEEYLFILPILGFWAFYTIWETSSHYSFVALSYMIILFSIYFKDVIGLIENNLKRITRRS